MRIALVSREYPPETPKGGLATQTWLKARALASFGHEVHVISETPRAEPASGVEAGVHVTRIPGFHQRLVMRTPVVEWLTYSAHVAEALEALDERSSLDIIDFPEWACEGFVPLLNRSGQRRCAMVIQLHSPLVMFAHTMGWPPLDSEFYRLGTTMEATTLRLADAVYSSSACATDWCVRYYGVRREDVPTLHAGVDTDLFAPRAGLKASRPTIVYVGRLVWNKGVQALVEAACRLALDYPALHLCLIGAGDTAIVEQLRSRAAAAGRSDVLEIVGYVGHEELAGRLARAHVFAAPSIYEAGPGFSCLEAMSCGLPIVACDGSGVADVVTHRDTGLLVPPDDLDALTNALHRLLESPDDREALGTAARAWVVANAETRSSVRRIEAFYQRVIERVTGACQPAC